MVFTLPLTLPDPQGLLDFSKLRFAGTKHQERGNVKDIFPAEEKPKPREIRRVASLDGRRTRTKRSDAILPWEQHNPVHLHDFFLLTLTDG